MNDVIRSLRNEGWRLNDNKVQQLLSNQEIKPNYDNLKNFFLNTDIKLYCDPWMDVSNKTDVDCDGILQVYKIRNVAAPEVDQENKNNIPLYKYAVTDGVNSMFLLDLRSHSSLKNSLELGGKLYLKGKFTYKSGMLLISDNKAFVKSIGGKVMDLIKADTFSQSNNYRHTNSREGDPPKFLPFGAKLNVNMREVQNFKALESNGPTTSTETTEFGSQREAQIRKVKDHSDRSTLLDKFHSGGTSTFVKNTLEKQDMIDNNLAELMRYGFNINESKQALNVSNNNLNEAVDYLQKRRTKSQNITEEEPKSRSIKSKGKPKTDYEVDDPKFDPARYAEQMGLAGRPINKTSLAELMGNVSGVNEDRHLQSAIIESRNEACMIRRGYKCQAQVMNGSYEPAVVLEVLPGKCVCVQYVLSREIVETHCSCLRTISGEKILEYMIPNTEIAVEKPHSGDGNRYQQSGGYGRGRGAGRGRGGRGGRYRRSPRY